ncbi:MAG TPA: hypothetical protein VE775_04745 [Pyrinomonadaceae bacterium]|jgi:type II secretory pathway pseudopilin PulG|nr:hypothetical protein [Pyrinomonadaceae bacterium]
MKRLFVIIVLALAASAGLPGAHAQAQTAQQKDAARDETREKLRQLLDTAGQRKDVTVTFRQADKQPYNFVGVMRDGLTNAESLEIVVSVTPNETIGFRVYPHYKGGYINIGKAKDSPGLMRKLLYMSDRNFLYWGADKEGDIFSGYTFTLESGFPHEAIVIVLRSIRNTDGFVGEMRPFIDGSIAP